MKILLNTLGCSKNTVDSEKISAALSTVHSVVTEGDADVFLLNTCSFIADAKQQSIDTILEAVQLKAAGHYSKVVVFGCLGERYGKDLPELIGEVDAWFGVRDFSPLLEYFGVKGNATGPARALSTPSHYAFLKISEGCDRRCSYCAIPLIRGAHHSVPIEELVQEAGMLAAKGVKELIVIAQDTTYYGLDIYGKRSLAALLHALSQVEGIHWIRMHYSYPAAFPEDVLEEMATNPKICKYIDIPLQHSSSKILKMMHRGVDEKAQRDLVDKFRKAVPGVVLRTTMIVGHPGESEDEFENLLQFVSDCRFERLGAFTYSEEEDTFDASHYPDDVAQEEKQFRYDRLMNIQEGISLEFNESRVGTQEEVIVDRYEDGILVCRSRWESPEVDGEILVKPEGIPDPTSLIGTFIKVRIDAADSYDLIATVI